MTGQRSGVTVTRSEGGDTSFEVVVAFPDLGASDGLCNDLPMPVECEIRFQLLEHGLGVGMALLRGEA